MTWLRSTRPSLADLPPDSTPVAAWLVFWPPEPDRRYWWSRWLHPGLAHVSVLRQEGNVWLALDHRLDYLEVRVLGPSWATVEEVLPPGWTLVAEVTGWRPLWRSRVPWVLAPFTCVEFAKHLLGLGGLWPLTPRQLLDRLHLDGMVRSIKYPRS